MKYESLQLELAVLEERIAAGEDAIANQKTAITRLLERGDSTLVAREQLAQLELEQSRSAAEWYRIRRELADLIQRT